MERLSTPLHHTPAPGHTQSYLPEMRTKAAAPSFPASQDAAGDAEAVKGNISPLKMWLHVHKSVWSNQVQSEISPSKNRDVSHSYSLIIPSNKNTLSKLFQSYRHRDSTTWVLKPGLSQCEHVLGQLGTSWEHCWILAPSSALSNRSVVEPENLFYVHSQTQTLMVWVTLDEPMSPIPLKWGVQHIRMHGQSLARTFQCVWVSFLHSVPCWRVSGCRLCSTPLPYAPNANAKYPPWRS